MTLGGGLVSAIAFPLLGVNASRMGSYLENKHPKFENPWTGWAFYGGGFASGAIGAWLLSSGNSEYNDRFDRNGVEDEDAGRMKVIAGGSLQVTGLVLNTTAFILFERKVFRCRNFFEDLSVAPTFMDGQGDFHAGARLTLWISGP